MFKKNIYRKTSYSQSGEDLIIDFIFKAIGMDSPVYLDIGAHHPFYLSNSALLYEQGSRGICIEPDPVLFKEIQKKRKRDICLNVGIGMGREAEADFYLMSSPTLNTFSKEEATKYLSLGYTIKEIIKTPLKNINSIIDECLDGSPDFVSIDVEGLDYGILKSIDFEKYRPKVLCIETVSTSGDRNNELSRKIKEYMLEKEYVEHSCTHINTIYVAAKVWENRAWRIRTPTKVVPL